MELEVAVDAAHIKVEVGAEVEVGGDSPFVNQPMGGVIP